MRRMAVDDVNYKFYQVNIKDFHATIEPIHQAMKFQVEDAP